MSFLDAISDYGGGWGAPGAAEYARGMIIQSRVQQGWSSSSILSELRANGLGIREGQSRAIIRAERERQGAAFSAAQIPVDYSTGTVLPGEPPQYWTGQYVHQVTVTYRERQDDGSYVLHTRTMGIRSGVPLSPLDASQQALGLMTMEPEDGEEPTGPDLSDILTTHLSGAWYDIDRRALRNAAGGAGGQAPGAF